MITLNCHFPVKKKDVSLRRFFLGVKHISQRAFHIPVALRYFQHKASPYICAYKACPLF